LYILGDYALYVFRILTLAAERTKKLSQLLDMYIYFLYIKCSAIFLLLWLETMHCTLQI